MVLSMKLRETQDIINDAVVIFEKNGNDAINYFNKTRKLTSQFGAGFAISYCWFYSTPQKWTYVEPKIFEISKKTQLFNLDLILEINSKSLALMFKPLLFSNELSKQFLCFCKAIKKSYGSWDNFKTSLELDDMFLIFNRIRKHKHTRLTFKNLAAMISFIGFEEKFPILDTHIGTFLGINRVKRSRFVTNENLFRNLLNFTQTITDDLSKTYPEVSTIKWSLAVWFNRTKLNSSHLLTNI